MNTPGCRPVTQPKEKFNYSGRGRQTSYDIRLDFTSNRQNVSLSLLWLPPESATTDYFSVGLIVSEQQDWLVFSILQTMSFLLLVHWDIRCQIKSCDTKASNASLYTLTTGPKTDWSHIINYLRDRRRIMDCCMVTFVRSLAYAIADNAALGKRK